MIKRNTRNIGKLVKINAPASVYHNRVGKIVDFRGDYEAGIPYVCVFVYDIGKTSGSIYPFAGHILEVIK